MRRSSDLLLLLVLATACAQVREPTGGPKDDTAPRSIASVPEHLSTRFSGDRILLTFDEKVKLERVSERVLISPPLEKTPEFRISGQRSVEILLRSPLAEDRTYVFNVGDAVVDLTEGNPARGTYLVFSTGDKVDSLAVRGSLREARTDLPLEGIAILAYHGDSADAFRTGRPAHFTRTAADGSFLLPHMREGAYHLRALKDMNGNYRYDLPNEEIAFLPDPVYPAPLDTTLGNVELRLFRERAESQAVLGSKVLQEGALQVVMARPVTDPGIRDVLRTGGRTTWAIEPSSGGDTLTFWPSDTTALKEGSYALSDAGVDLDTVRYRRTTAMPYHVGVQLRTAQDSTGTRTFLLTSRPIMFVDSSRIRFTKDSVSLPVDLRPLPERTRWLEVDVDLEPGESGVLTLLPKALQGLWGGTNDTLRSIVGRPDPASEGILHVSVKGLAPRSAPVLLQLLDGGGAVQRQSTLPEDGGITWPHLRPGTLSLRLVEDLNGNGRWDPGDLKAGRLPERVLLRPGTTNVRAAWEVETEWDANDW